MREVLPVIIVRWDSSRERTSPERTIENCGDFGRPFGTQSSSDVDARVEALGYSRMSLRDKEIHESVVHSCRSNPDGIGRDAAKTRRRRGLRYTSLSTALYLRHLRLSGAFGDWSLCGNSLG
jgi:hypothetical protein